jgi:protease II
MTTMLDDSIPLTTGEYDEWGIQIRKVLQLHAIVLTL